jgi:hypothetical protein
VIACSVATLALNVWALFFVLANHRERLLQRGPCS